MDTPAREWSVATDNRLQQQVATVGKRLRDAIAGLLGELAGAGMREQREIQNALNLSQPVTSRLFSCVRVNDPLATFARVPGPQGLRKILKGAARAGVKRDCLDDVDSAIREMEQLITQEVGDRESLDSLLSDWVHESRPSYELRQKYAAYKAMCALRGVQSRIHVSCGLFHPSDQAGTFDTVQIDALYGCRRVRPSASLQTTSRHLAPEPHRFQVTGLSGRPVESIQDIVLADFSTANLDRVETRQSGTLIQSIVRDLPLGKVPGADIVTALVSRGKLRSMRNPEDAPTTGLAGHAEPPSADLVVDVLLHDDVWPGVKPELRMFDTVVRGLAHPDDPIRQADRMEMLESIVLLGRGVAAFRIAEVPRYIEMIEHVCNSLNWDAQRFRGYRCKIRYPVYGAQVCLAFPLPVAPAEQ